MMLGQRRHQAVLLDSKHLAKVWSSQALRASGGQPLYMWRRQTVSVRGAAEGDRALKSASALW